MRLTETIIVTASIILLVSNSCSTMKKGARSTNAMPGTWQATPIAIDGDSKDWPSPYPNYDSKAKIAYATSNDNKFVYISMETGDELTQLKLLTGGMTVSIDTGGKKNLDFNIKYPLENSSSDIEIARPDNGSKEAAVHAARQMTQNIRKAVEQTNQFALDGFKPCDGGHMVSQINSCNIKVKMRLDEYKEIVWEAAIPVKMLYGKDSLTDAETGKPISVCFNVAGLKKPKSGTVDNINGNMGSDMNATPGTQHNSMQKGMGQSRSTTESPMEHLYTTTKTWKQFLLAGKP